MALSNWDTLALDLEGQSINGTFESPMGVAVSFYKNWLYIYDKKAWRGGAFSKPCVGEVQEGQLQYLDVEIKAIRGPQNGVFAVVTSGYEHDKTLKGMVGCGVYGFDGSEWIGVNEESMNALQGFLSQQSDDAVKKVSLAGALRFNQGDMYIAEHCGEEAPATEPGKSEDPILIQGLRKKE